MRISNETKVGVIAVIIITLMILGFNFLKGNDLFSKNFTLYAKYKNIQGLTPSNPVFINGLQVGTVKSISYEKNMKELIVTINITKDIDIPKNSIALIIPNPLSNTKVEIKLGDSNKFLKDKDYLITDANKGLLDDVMSKVDPVLFEVKNSLNSLDSLLGNVNEILDPNTKQDLNDMIQNFRLISASLVGSTNSLQNLLNNSNSPLLSSLNNVNSITATIAGNENKINDIIRNLQQTTEKISKLDLKTTLNTLDGTLASLKGTIDKLNSKDGSIGMLMNDSSLYKNFSATGNKINLLLDDIRIHPKRYVSISVFGKKQKKSTALMTPLPDTLNAPYIKKP